jgi:cytochrome c-type biogenesis protein CcmE
MTKANLMSKKILFTVAGVAIIVICIGIILYSASEYVNPYHTVSEAPSLVGQQIQVIGRVVSDSIQLSTGNLNFQITDGDAIVNVSYLGAPPQNFDEEIEVVVIGTMNTIDTFGANQILTKCPSKYD